MATEWAQIFRFKSESIIETKNASKNYRHSGEKIEAVQEATLRIRKGTLTVIIGPSASGKTTLLHMLAGLVKPSSGAILYRGLDLSRAEDVVLKLLREEYISVVFQEQSLIKYLTVKENVELPLELMGIEKNDRHETCVEALSLLGLDNRQNHLVEELSGGERNKVNLARAMAKRPEVVLADEPTANLDTKSSQRIVEIIRNNIQDQGTTFIVATHDPVLTEKADLVLEMRDGRISLPRKYWLEKIELVPLRHLNNKIFSLIRETIQTQLEMQILSEGEAITILGTPYRVQKVMKNNEQAEGCRWGVVTKNTDLILREIGQGQSQIVASEEKKHEWDKLKRTGYLNPLYTILCLIAIIPSVFLVILAFAAWIRIGIWTSVSTASLIVAVLISLQAVLLRPSRSTILSSPYQRLCNVCGIRQSNNVCHQCGRQICPECLGDLIREPSFCSECITCPVCGSERVESMCLACGNYVCSYCNQDGFCLECLSTKVNQEIERLPKGKLRTLILEPEKDIANDTCKKLGNHLHQDLHGKTVRKGDLVYGVGEHFKVLASLPIGGGIITQSITINVMNRVERDAVLKQYREGSDFPTCFHEACDYMIRRSCWICRRPVCPNHSTICRECGNVVCQDHHENQICETCLKGPRKVRAKEILSPFFRLVLPQLFIVSFLMILLGGEQLNNIHPILQVSLLGLLLSIPVPYLLYIKKKRKNSR